MADIPRESRDLNAAMIPVEQVKLSMSLAFDQGQGMQLFQVDSVGFSSVRQDDGSYRNVFKLTSGATADGSPPWVIELPAGTQVCRILGYAA